MLNWICPDCGRECAPTSRECPGCAEQSHTRPASASYHSAAQSVPVPPSVMLMAPPAPVPNGNGHRSQEPPQPTPETLQALVENLEQQIQPEPEIARNPEPAVQPPVAALVAPSMPAPVAPQPIELDESTRQAFLEAQKVHVEELLDLQAQDAAREGAILKIAGSFQLMPSTLLLNAAQDVVQPPARMQQKCLAMPRPNISMRPPADSGPAAPASPQPLLLAGPILPAELRNLGNGRTTRSAKHGHKKSVPTWMISVTVITVMILGLASVMQNRSADRSPANPSSVAPMTVQSTPEPAATPSDQHPLARFVEVTGLRVVADLQHRSQLEYIVVNHCGSELSGLVLHITVRSNLQDGTPLFRVSAAVPSLGPYQAKELRTDVDTQLQSTAIPEWDDLKADVRVTTR